jgi:hypothetical protein
MKELLGVIVRAQLCTTLEQRWSACRVWIAGSGHPRYLQAAVELSRRCNPRPADFNGSARRPGSSPRRRQCRNGTGSWPHSAWSYCAANAYHCAMQAKLDQHRTDFIELISRYQL